MDGNVVDSGDVKTIKITVDGSQLTKEKWYSVIDDLRFFLKKEGLRRSFNGSQDKKNRKCVFRFKKDNALKVRYYLLCAMDPEIKNNIVH